MFSAGILSDTAVVVLAGVLSDAVHQASTSSLLIALTAASALLAACAPGGLCLVSVRACGQVAAARYDPQSNPAKSVASVVMGLRCPLTCCHSGSGTEIAAARRGAWGATRLHLFNRGGRGRHRRAKKPVGFWPRALEKHWPRLGDLRLEHIGKVVGKSFRHKHLQKTRDLRSSGLTHNKSPSICKRCQASYTIRRMRCLVEMGVMRKTGIVAILVGGGAYGQQY